MSSSESLRARALELTDDHLVVELEDGSRHSAPISLFPVLADAPAEERARWHFTGGGTGIHWPDIDEDISVFSIVYPERTVPMRSETTARLVRESRERRRNRSA